MSGVGSELSFREIRARAEALSDAVLDARGSAKSSRRDNQRVLTSRHELAQALRDASDLLDVLRDECFRRGLDLRILADELAELRAAKSADQGGG